MHQKTRLKKFIGRHYINPSGSRKYYDLYDDWLFKMIWKNRYHSVLAYRTGGKASWNQKSVQRRIMARRAVLGIHG